MSTLLSALIGFLAFFLSSFIFWRRLREDYPPGKIFSFTIILLVGGVMGSLGILAAFSFWPAFLLVSLLTLYLVKKLNLKLFEVLDSLVPSVLLFIFIYALGLGLSKIPADGFNMKLLAEAGLALFGLVAFRFFQGRYRRFSWYPSGKVGFLGLATLSLYFFARFLVAILFPVVLSSSVPEFYTQSSFAYSGILSLILSLFVLFAVYLRSGRPGAERVLLKWSNRHFLSVWKK